MVLLLQLFSQNLRSQSNLVSKSISVSQRQFSFDTLSVVPSSFFIFDSKGGNIDTALFEVDFGSSTINWKGEVPSEIKLIYRVFPIDFSQTYEHKNDSILFRKDTMGVAPLVFKGVANSNDIFGSSAIQRSGSISRGFSVGNNQNLAVNSSLNLQLSGKLNDELSINASINDDNIPIQPQGNTQQLQDFDQVFIKLKSRNWQLTAGDFWLSKPSGYFMNYNKRGQGGSFEYNRKDFADFADSSSIKTRASIAVSKGKFARNEIQGVENNQGPYRLTGSENEQFIIVLSGTESVFIDGELLTRGQEHDYIIDYNTAEITFTANRLITKDKRIKVEFQYSDKNFARSLIESSTEAKINDWNIRFNFYSEQDAKNQPLQQELDDNAIQTLIDAGDNPLLAVTNGWDTLGFDDNANRYRRLDSLGYEIFQISYDQEEAIYSVSFSNFGVGNGDYVEDGFSAFGKVFKWVAPDTINGDIVHNGTHRPLRILVTPKKRQMATLGIGKSIGKGFYSNIEFVYTDQDINTFSNLDRDDDLGWGILYTLKGKHNLNKDWSVNSIAKFETVSQDFQRIERFRDVEFERNWNLQNLVKSIQYFGIVGIDIRKKQDFRLNYTFNNFIQEAQYNGVKNDVNLALNKKIKINYNASLLNANGNQKSDFYRHKSKVVVPLRFLNVGFEDELERNKYALGDSLQAGSYAFYDYQFYLEQGDSAKNKVRMFYRERTDQALQNGSLIQSTRALNPGALIQFNSNSNHQFVLKSNLRILQISDTSLTENRPENSLLNRVEVKSRFLKGGIRSNLFYEVGSGLELRKEFSYIEVPAGQGVYTWIDYNNDGIKDLNEFEIAEFPDQAIYIRINTPSNDYIKVFSNQFSELITINFRNIINKENKALGWLRRINTQTNYRIERKSSLDDLLFNLNPFDNRIEEDFIESANNSFRNSVFFNRTKRVFGTEYTYSTVQSKVLLANGSEARERLSHEIKTRLNLNRSITVLLDLSQEDKNNYSDYTSGRNYELDIRSIKGTFRFQPNTQGRISAIGGYREKFNNPVLSNANAYISEIGIDFKYNRLKKSSFTGNFKYLSMIYNGEDNTALSYEILESLRSGNNYTWNLGYQQTFANNLQLTINYQGRKSEDNPIIHTGGMSLRAFF